MIYQFCDRFQGNPAHPCILFLHGFMGNIEEFADVIDVLKADFFCLAMDLPGHGETKVNTTDDFYAMSKVAAGIIDFLDQRNIHQCLLIGYSMGGRLGLYLALNYPSRFTRVILESASPGLATQIEREERVKSDLAIARKLMRTQNENDFEQFLINWYQQPIFGDIKSHPNFGKMLNQRLRCRPTELAKSLIYMGTGVQLSLWEALINLKLPVLLIVGEKDSKFVEINQKICTVSPDFSLKIIPNYGHNIHFENPNLFAEVCSNFFLKKNTKT